MTDDSTCIGHESCPSCGSTDNLARYSDGHAHCFTPGCDYREKGGTDTPVATKRRASPTSLLTGEYVTLKARGITADTCKLWRYAVVAEAKHPKTGAMESCQAATYCDEDGTPVAQKLRFRDKAMKSVGDTKALSTMLYGRHLWRDGGRKVVVTEGEIDALSVSQLQSNKWPVVSIPQGAAGAAKAIAANLEWLCRFEEVILMFDDDEAGRTAVEECAPLLPHGKCKVARIAGFKDANDALKAGRGAAVIDAIWGAKEFRLGGIVVVSDLREKIMLPAELGEPWPFETLTRMTYGRRFGELYGLGAGTGIGKTTLFKQLEAFDIERGEKVGIFHLEENNVHTLKTLAGSIDGKRYHIPGVAYDPTTLAATLDTIEDRVALYDDSHNAGFKAITERMRYMRWSLGVRYFYLDHLTALAAAMDEDNERRAIDKMMEQMAKLALDLDGIIHYVSHLTAPDTGKPHEEGGRVMERHFRGSRSIAYWTHGLFALEGNKQMPGSPRTFRVLKERFAGDANGLTFGLRYNKDTGRMEECPLDEDSTFADETGTDRGF